MSYCNCCVSRLDVAIIPDQIPPLHVDGCFSSLAHRNQTPDSHCNLCRLRLFTPRLRMKVHRTSSGSHTPHNVNATRSQQSQNTHEITNFDTRKNSRIVCQAGILCDLPSLPSAVKWTIGFLAILLNEVSSTTNELTIYSVVVKSSIRIYAIKIIMHTKLVNYNRGLLRIACWMHVVKLNQCIIIGLRWTI